MTVSRVKVRFPTKFPSSVAVSSPITLSRVGGSYTFELDLSALRSYLDPYYMVGTINSLVLNGATSGSTTVQASAIAGSTLLTLPAATDTLVGKATTDVLTNKTYDTAGTGNSFQINGVAVTDNTGTGKVVRDTSPTLVTPALGVASATSLAATGAVTSSGTAGVGYATGAGGTVTQGTSRTTGVTINKTSGAITLFTAAGSATATSFTVTNSTVAATDTISLSVKSATNKYNAFVTAVAAGSFEITFNTTGGTSSDAPVINFNVIKGVAA